MLTSDISAYLHRSSSVIPSYGHASPGAIAPSSAASAAAWCENGVGSVRGCADLCVFGQRPVRIESQAGLHTSFKHMVLHGLIWFCDVLRGFILMYSWIQTFGAKTLVKGVKTVELSPVLAKILSGGSRLFPAVMAALLSPSPAVESPSLEVAPRLLSLMQLMQPIYRNIPFQLRPNQQASRQTLKSHKIAVQLCATLATCCLATEQVAAAPSSQSLAVKHQIA